MVSPDHRKINVCLALMRGIVTHPNPVVVPDQARIAAVASAGQCQHGFETFARHSGEDRSAFSAAAACRRPETSVRQANEVGAAEVLFYPGPRPIGVGWTARADPMRSGQGDQLTVGHEAERRLAGVPGVVRQTEFSDPLPIECVAAAVQHSSSRSSALAQLTDAPRPPTPPGPPPQPVVFGQQLLRLCPVSAVDRKTRPGSASAVLIVFAVHDGAHDQQQSTIRHRRELGITQVHPLLFHQRRRRPLLPIRRHDHPDVAVAAAVLLRFAKRAPPAVAKTNQVGERVVWRAIPDLVD